MHIHRVGVYGWLLATPLFLAANVITELAWRHPPFNWATNNISDLGNVTCGMWDTTRPREVCSPWHVAMNSAMVATGVLLGLGVLLTWSALGHGVATTAAQLLTLAGLALGLTGLALFLARVDLGFGVGGMERIAVFPLLIWTIAVAVRLTR
jgi:hypothetical membrane protein